MENETQVDLKENKEWEESKQDIEYWREKSKESE